LALEVLVTVNETSTYRLRMHSEEGRKGRLRLPGTRRIKRLDIAAIKRGVQMKADFMTAGGDFFQRTKAGGTEGIVHFTAHENEIAGAPAFGRLHRGKLGGSDQGLVYIVAQNQVRPRAYRLGEAFDLVTARRNGRDQIAVCCGREISCHGTIPNRASGP